MPFFIWVVYVGIVAFPAVLDMGGNYFCALPFWNVDGGPGGDRPLFLCLYVETGHCCRAVGGPHFYYTMYC